MDVILFKPGDTAIKGESTLGGHVDEIELHGYSHGVTMACTVDQSHTERTSGRSQHQDFTISKYTFHADQQYLEEKEKEQSLKEAIVQPRPFFRLPKPKLGQRQWWPSPKRTGTPNRKDRGGSR